MKNSRKREFVSNRVQYISIDRICPNPRQPRRNFDEAALRELATSIRNYGVLQPLSVRRMGDRYELVAGERRLRAGRMAGLREIPCLVVRAEEEDSALLALIENLQRRDLTCWEEAEAIARLMGIYGLGQEQTAEKLGKSQSAISNKLRLLRLPESVREILQKEALSERHARALLRLEGESEQLGALAEILRRRMNVARTEEYVEQLLQDRQTQPPHRRSAYIIKDVRLFLNSIDRGLRLIRSAGVAAACGREETEGEILLTIRIPKNKGKSI